MIDGAADTLRDTDGFGRQAICELRAEGKLRRLSQNSDKIPNSCLKLYISFTGDLVIPC